LDALFEESVHALTIKTQNRYQIAQIKLQKRLEKHDGVWLILDKRHNLTLWGTAKETLEK